MSTNHLKSIVNKLLKFKFIKLVVTVFFFFCKPRIEQLAAKQAHPPINILIFNKLFLPNFSIVGHNIMYVGSSTAPANKKFKCSSELKAGA